LKLKNQNDLIVMIATAVVCLGVGLGFFFNKRTPDKPAPPKPVPTAAAKRLDGAVVFANGLPGSSNNSGGGGGGGGRGAGPVAGGF